MIVVSDNFVDPKIIRKHCFAIEKQIGNWSLKSGLLRILIHLYHIWSFHPTQRCFLLKKNDWGVNYSPYQSLASSSHWCLQCFPIKIANFQIANFGMLYMYICVYIYICIYNIYIYIYTWYIYIWYIYIYVSYNVIDRSFRQNTLVVTCCRTLWIHCTSCPPRGLGVLHRVFPEEKDGATRARPGWADDDNMNQFGFNCHRDVRSSSWSSNFDR